MLGGLVVCILTCNDTCFTIHKLTQVSRGYVKYENERKTLYKTMLHLKICIELCQCISIKQISICHSQPKTQKLNKLVKENMSV